MKMKTGKVITTTTDETIRVCDCCKTPLGLDYIEFDFRWDDGYDHYGDVLEVCSVECLLSEVESYDHDMIVQFPGGEDVSLTMPSGLMKKFLFPRLDGE